MPTTNPILQSVVVTAFAILTPTLATTSHAVEPPPTRTWVRAWNGPANHSDEPAAVLMLADHSVIVAGDTYDPAPGAAGHHPVILRYDAAGNVMWSIIEPGFDRFVSLHKSITGDVLLVGHLHDGTSWNVFVRRIDPVDGGTVWQAQHPAALSFGPFKPGIAEDAATQRLLVATTLANDQLILRFDLNDGAFIDEFSFDGPQHVNDVATTVAPYGKGGFVFAGPEGNSSGGYRTIAADANGEVLWSDHENGQIGNTFTPAWLGVDAQGNVLVGGGPETTCGLFQFRAWKISPAGTRLWTRSWPTANCASAEPAEFDMGSDGSIAMVGQTHNPFNIAVMHVDPAGEMWTQTWNGPAGGLDDGVGVAIDPIGNVIVAGEAGAAGGDDLAVIGWSKAGAQIFSRVQAAQATGTDIVMDLSSPDADSFAIASYAFSVGQNSNFYVSRFDRNRRIGDVNGDNVINVADLLAVISNWGPCPQPPSACTGDIAPDPAGDGQVNVGDLLLVITNWGT